MKIKSKPEDFYVKEIIDLDKKEPGNKYRYFILWKKNMNTINAIKLIAKKFRISKKRIYFAGEKDKETVSEQYIAIENLDEFKEEYNFGNVRLKYVGSFNDPLRISDIKYNYFKIVIRDVSKDEKERFLENLNIFKEYFFNYFDEQRFGSRLNNHLIGKEIIKRNWEEAIKILLTDYKFERNLEAIKARSWLKENWGNFKEALKYFPKYLDVEIAVLNSLILKKDYKKAFKSIHKRLVKLFLHAYQSYIWNLSLSEFIRKNSRTYKEIDLKIMKLIITDEIDKFKGKTWPLIGYNINHEFIEEILKMEGIDKNMLYFRDQRSLTLISKSRNILEKVYDLNYKVSDDTIVLEFKLSRGSYATMFIKHLF